MQKRRFLQNSSKISSGGKHGPGGGGIAIKFCSDWRSGSHFIAQASKFLVNTIAIGLSKVLHSLSYGVLIAKLSLYGVHFKFHTQSSILDFKLFNAVLTGILSL